VKRPLADKDAILYVVRLVIVRQWHLCHQTCGQFRAALICMPIPQELRRLMDINSVEILGDPENLNVKANRKLQTPEEAEAFNDQLVLTLNQHQEENPHAQLKFEDLDISQNPIPVEQFDALFSTLATMGVHVMRLKMFGCPTVNDEVCGYIGRWLSQVTADNCPSEIHLSDCAITGEGFLAIMTACENNIGVPRIHPNSQRTVPLYLRLEGNYIPEALIHQKVEEGVIGQFQKSKGASKGEQQIPEGAKCKLLVTQMNQFRQNEGEPPPPEDAPPPKAVKAWNSSGIDDRRGPRGPPGPLRNYNSNRDQSKQPPWSRDSKSQNGSWKDQGQWDSWKKESWNDKWKKDWDKEKWNQNSWNGGGAGGGKGRSKGSGTAYAALPSSASQSAHKGSSRGGGGWAIGAAPSSSQRATPSSAGDRSRTPKPRQPKEAPPGVLPPNWEEQWSDEYSIPYYWNNKTGESVWEKPN